MMTELKSVSFKCAYCGEANYDVEGVVKTKMRWIYTIGVIRGGTGSMRVMEVIVRAVCNECGKTNIIGK